MPPALPGTAPETFLALLPIVAAIPLPSPLYVSPAYDVAAPPPDAACA
ncbi:MAG: hypothetical protein KF847_17975 [Pirellulales bacterium]|nr:hypothetical protein [Pirellulales bacterium]